MGDGSPATADSDTWSVQGGLGIKSWGGRGEVKISQAALCLRTSSEGDVDYLRHCPRPANVPAESDTRLQGVHPTPLGNDTWPAGAQERFTTGVYCDQIDMCLV